MRNLIFWVLLSVTMFAKAEDVSFEVVLKLKSQSADTFSLSTAYDHALNQEVKQPSAELSRSIESLKNYFEQMPELNNCEVTSTDISVINMVVEQSLTDAKVDLAGLDSTISFDNTIFLSVSIKTNACTAATKPELSSERAGLPTRLTTYDLKRSKKGFVPEKAILAHKSFVTSGLNSFSGTDNNSTKREIELIEIVPSIAPSELAPVCLNGSQVNRLSRRHSLVSAETNESVGEVIYTGLGICKN